MYAQKKFLNLPARVLFDSFQYDINYSACHSLYVLLSDITIPFFTFSYHCKHHISCQQTNATMLHKLLTKCSILQVVAALTTGEVIKGSNLIMHLTKFGAHLSRLIDRQIYHTCIFYTVADYLCSTTGIVKRLMASV